MEIVHWSYRQTLGEWLLWWGTDSICLHLLTLLGCEFLSHWSLGRCKCDLHLINMPISFWIYLIAILQSYEQWHFLLVIFCFFLVLNLIFLIFYFLMANKSCLLYELEELLWVTPVSLALNLSSGSQKKNFIDI